jgi:hypothetical protein
MPVEAAGADAFGTGLDAGLFWPRLAAAFAETFAFAKTKSPFEDTIGIVRLHLGILSIISLCPKRNRKN